jgi:hypothetical protein
MDEDRSLLQHNHPKRQLRFCRTAPAQQWRTRSSGVVVQVQALQAFVAGGGLFLPACTPQAEREELMFVQGKLDAEGAEQGERWPRAHKVDSGRRTRLLATYASCAITGATSRATSSSSRSSSYSASSPASRSGKAKGRPVSK